MGEGTDYLFMLIQIGNIIKKIVRHQRIIVAGYTVAFEIYLMQRSGKRLTLSNIG